MPGIEPLVFQSLWVAIAVLAIVAMGSVVQAGLGMGFGLTVAPVLALIDPALVPAPALYLGMSTAIIGAVSESRSISWKQVGTGMIGRTVGIVSGVVLLTLLVDRTSFQLLFGILIAAAVALSIIGWKLKLSIASLLSMGWISGFMGVITSVGAPPLALIYQEQPSETARPTLAAFFAFGGFISLVALYSTGWAGIREFYLALFMAPAAIIGTLFGRHVREKFDANYKPALLFVAGTASILLIIKGLS